MAYKRRTSPQIEEAQKRAINLGAIHATLDLGNQLTLAAYKDEITATQGLLVAYNVKLAEADAALNDLRTKEQTLKTLSARMLAGVGVKYGKDSNEYEQAGGTRTSEIKRTRSSTSSETTG